MLARIVNSCGFVCAFVTFIAADVAVAAEPVRYCRFRTGDKVAYGLVEGDRVRELSGEFAAWKKTETTHALSDVKLLVPSEPTQVLALAGNYESHLGAEDTVTTTVTTIVTVKTDRKTGKTSLAILQVNRPVDDALVAQIAADIQARVAFHIEL